MSRAEWTIRLEPHGVRLRELVETIEAEVEHMPAGEIEDLLRACRTAEAQPLAEMDWPVAKIAPLVGRIAKVELGRREGKAQIREALAL